MTEVPPHDSRGRPPVIVPRDGPLRPPVKRFYKSVGIGEASAGGSFQLLLDGRKARTPGKSELSLPTRELALAIATEWETQGATLDPLTMPLTRLVNTAIDGVTPNAAAVRADLVKFAGSDMVCYRATHPTALRERQMALWGPVVAWARARLDVAPKVVEGLMPVTQPAELGSAVAAAVEQLDPYRLSAVHTMTTLTGSVLLALGVHEQAWPVETAWLAANVDEDWQISQWGEDEEAAIRRRSRQDDMTAAARLLALLEPG